MSTGIEGLDYIMDGGLPTGHVYLIRGEPGTGKTTMALQYMNAGARNGEPALYVTLSQTARELDIIASSYGMSLDGMDVHSGHDLFGEASAQSVIDTSEMELERLVGRVRDILAETKPTRVVIDSLIDLRLRALDVLAYRRLFRELMDILIAAQTTTLFLDSDPEYGGDSQVTALVHGVLSLRRALPGYGIAQRRLEINKLRGVAHAEGLHDFTILANGVRVFPRLTSELDAAPPSLDTVGTGLAGLDELTCGGVSQGTALMIYGQAGTGKSTLAASIIRASIDRGDQAAAFMFEEHPKTFLKRADRLGIPLTEENESGRFITADMRAGEVLPGEFVHMVLDAADRKPVKTVVIDSVNGYVTAAANKDHALAQLNTLVATLRSRQVVTVLVVEQPGFLTQIGHSLDVSILSDCIILLRQYEPQSMVRRSITVLKKRTGPHSTELRELVMEDGRMDVVAIPPDRLETMRQLHLLNSHAPI
ncbi:AAA family ATPase [Hoeflea sp. WL0058]|uniref:non-specific serine/threonine protein kinase n=1 Tax=Flavimaribacter sediminis TaxID=2865987 RepID=A0AAE3D4B2_9HYPH|nr:ATPase domain-containing protein [Flavimaribacter sediminis]MBW8640658.1 AAA family ATPase [Flavimaribacter sediminis]